jgi:hypothetical protein
VGDEAEIETEAAFRAAQGDEGTRMTKTTITLDENEQIAIRIALRDYLEAWESRQPGPYRSPVFVHRGSNVAYAAKALNRLINIAHGQPENHDLNRAPHMGRPVRTCIEEVTA